MSDTNNYVPDVTVNLTDTDVARLKEAVSEAAGLFGEGQMTTIAVNVADRLVAGENVLRAGEAFQLDKAITVKDAGGDPFSLLLGLSEEEQSDAYKAINGPLSEVRGKVSLLVGDDNDRADEAQAQFDAQLNELAPIAEEVTV